MITDTMATGMRSGTMTADMKSDTTATGMKTMKGTPTTIEAITMAGSRLEWPPRLPMSRSE